MFKFHFDADILNSVAGGRSVLDAQKLNIHSLEAAESFIYSYGFDIQQPHTLEKLWYYHRRALVFMTEKLRLDIHQIPEILRERKKLEDIRRLLVYASSGRPQEKELQKWSCALLRCMHVFVHAENDMFHFFSEEIQNQILSPIQQHIVHDGSHHKTYLVSKKDHTREKIELLAFEQKPFKTSSSSVIKLLAKPEAIAMRLFDKVGIRFVTKTIFDSFRLIRFLVDEDVISYPHIMPDQSSNNIYPVDLFLKVAEELEQKKHHYTQSEVEAILEKRFHSVAESVRNLFRKENSFSGESYRFIKFISRKLIHISPRDNKEPFSFFYPFEVQIMDEISHQKMLSGPSKHDAYKERQMQAARKRLFSQNG